MSLFITSLTWAAKVEVASQVGWHFIYVTKNVHCTYIRIMLCIFHLLPILYNCLMSHRLRSTFTTNILINFLGDLSAYII